MSIVAVENYCVSVVTGMTVPGFTKPMQVFLSAPVTVKTRQAPTLYIWDKKFPWKRDSFPRAKPGDLSTGGFIERKHTVYMWFDAVYLPSNKNRNQQFKGAVEQIVQAMTNCESNVTLTDPNTAQTSILLSLAERGEVSIAVDHTILKQRMFVNSAALMIEAIELVQG